MSFCENKKLTENIKKVNQELSVSFSKFDKLQEENMTLQQQIETMSKGLNQNSVSKTTEDSEAEIKRLNDVVKKFKLAKAKDQFDFGFKLSSKDKIIKELQEQTAIHKGELAELKSILETLSGLNSNTYEGRQKIKEILSRFPKTN